MSGPPPEEPFAGIPSSPYREPGAVRGRFTKPDTVTIALGIAGFSCGNGGGKPSSEDSAAGYHKIIGIGASRIEAAGTDTLDFGTLRRGEVLEYRLGVRNDDSVAMVVLNLTTDCGCTTTDYGKNPVKPGETTHVTLRYDSAGQYGWQSKSIRLYTSLHPHPLVIRFFVDVAT